MNIRDIKIGDEVRIVRTWPSFEGWDVGWVPAMDSYVGSTFIVAEIDTPDNSVTSREGSYWFPPQALESVQSTCLIEPDPDLIKSLKAQFEATGDPKIKKQLEDLE